MGLGQMSRDIWVMDSAVNMNTIKQNVIKKRQNNSFTTGVVRTSPIQRQHQSFFAGYPVPG